MRPPASRTSSASTVLEDLDDLDVLDVAVGTTAVPRRAFALRVLRHCGDAYEEGHAAMGAYPDPVGGRPAFGRRQAAPARTYSPPATGPRRHSLGAAAHYRHVEPDGLP